MRNARERANNNYYYMSLAMDNYYTNNNLILTLNKCSLSSVFIG